MLRDEDDSPFEGNINWDMEKFRETFGFKLQAMLDQLVENDKVRRQVYVVEPVFSVGKRYQIHGSSYVRP